MANTVPYEGFPTVSPQFEPTPSVSINTPPAAFGVNVAEAVGHLGQIQQGAGKELFDRAYAFQELHENAAANAALADSQNKQLDRFLQFKQLEGKASVDAYPGYQSDMDKIREDSAAGLSPYAQQLYNQESRQSTFRMKWYGGEQAGQENKRYLIGSADARIDAATKEMQAAPTDQATVEQSLTTIRESVQHKFGDIGGMSPEEVKQKQADAVNVAVNGRIRSLAKDQPIVAQRLFDQAVKDGDLFGNDLTNLSWYIRNQRDNIGARTTAQQVLEGGRNDGGPVLRALFRNESGGRDINNTTQGTSSGQAQGFFQITTGTWKQFADKAGVDLREYPQAHGTPYSIQAQVANVIPLSRWDSSTIVAMKMAGGKLDITKTLGENLAANGEGLGSGITPQPTLADLVKRGNVISEQQFPGDFGYRDKVTDGIITQYDKELAIRRDTDFHYEQDIASVLINGVGPEGKLPTNVEELKLDPTGATAWDYMETNHPTELHKFLEQMKSNARGDVVLTEARLAIYDNLRGEASHDPKKFLAEDILGADLPIGAKKELLDLKQRVFKGEEADPNISRAIRIPGIAQQLQDLGLTKDGDKDNLNLFSASLGDQMKLWAQENGKPPNAEQTEILASRLLQQTAVSGGFHPLGGTSKKPFFESEGTDAAAYFDFSTNARDLAQKTLGYVPTDQEVQRWWSQLQYSKQYGKSQGGETSFTPSKRPGGKLIIEGQ